MIKKYLKWTAGLILLAGWTVGSLGLLAWRKIRGKKLYEREIR